MSTGSFENKPQYGQSTSARYGTSSTKYAWTSVSDADILGMTPSSISENALNEKAVDKYYYEKGV